MKITQIAQDVVKNKTAVLIRLREHGEYDVKPMFTGSKRGWVVLDAMTAQAIVKVREALKDSPKVDKFDFLPLRTLVDFCWKHVG
jgi:hypothetical protein